MHAAPVSQLSLPLSVDLKSDVGGMPERHSLCSLFQAWPTRLHGLSIKLRRSKARRSLLLPKIYLSGCRFDGVSDEKVHDSRKEWIVEALTRVPRLHVCRIEI